MITFLKKYLNNVEFRTRSALMRFYILFVSPIWFLLNYMAIFDPFKIQMVNMFLTFFVSMFVMKLMNAKILDFLVNCYLEFCFNHEDILLSFVLKYFITFYSLFKMPLVSASLLLLVFLPINGFFGFNFALVFFGFVAFFIALISTVIICFCFCLEYSQLRLEGKDPRECETSIFADLQKIDVTLLGIQTIIPFRLDYDTFRFEASCIIKFGHNLFAKMDKVGEARRFVGHQHFKNSGKVIQTIINNPKFSVGIAVGGGIGASAWLLNEYLKRERESRENALKRQHEKDRWAHESRENALNRQHERDRNGPKRGWPFGGNSSKFVAEESSFLDFLSEISASSLVLRLFVNTIILIIRCIGYIWTFVKKIYK